MGGETIPTFECKDIGMQCGFKAEAPTESELMPKIAKHAAKAHNIMKVDAGLETKIKAAIKK